MFARRSTRGLAVAVAAVVCAAAVLVYRVRPPRPRLPAGRRSRRRSRSPAASGRQPCRPCPARGSRGQRGRDHRRHPAPRPPRSLRSRLRHPGRLAPRARGRGVRAGRLARPPDAPLPLVDLHRPLPAAPRGARQRRLHPRQGRHHPRREAPRARLRDRGGRRLVRARRALGPREGPRDLRRLLRLLRHREACPHGGRAARWTGRGSRARVASYTTSRRPAVLPVDPPLRPARPVHAAGRVPAPGPDGLRRRGGVCRRPGRAAAGRARRAEPAAEHRDLLPRRPRRVAGRARRGGARHLPVRRHARRADDPRAAFRRRRPREPAPGGPARARPRAAGRRRPDGARPRRPAGARGPRRRQPAAAGRARGRGGAVGHGGRGRVGRARRPGLLRRDLVSPLPPRLERARPRGDGSLELDPSAASRALRPPERPEGTRKRPRPAPERGGHPRGPTRGHGPAERDRPAEAREDRPRGARAPAGARLRRRGLRRQSRRAALRAPARSQGPDPVAARPADRAGAA